MGWRNLFGKRPKPEPPKRVAPSPPLVIQTVPVISERPLLNRNSIDSAVEYFWDKYCERTASPTWDGFIEDLIKKHEECRAKHAEAIKPLTKPIEMRGFIP